MRKSVLITLFLLSVLLAVMVAQKINLTTADLGRHIKNGEIMLNAPSINSGQDGSMGLSRSDLLHTNFYSYTEPDSPFVNHHWASGVLFYFIFSIFGWTGLSIFNILLMVGAFALLFLLASKKLPLLLLIPISLLLIPLIADRTEIRPETISYFFIALFIYILSTYLTHRKRVLYLLPILMIFWANLHIYFVFGLFILGAFLVERLARQDLACAKRIVSILVLSVLASFVTPFGPKALLYPFTIFQNYGYRLVENQSISFLENISFYNPIFLWWKIVAVLGALLTAVTFWPASTRGDSSTRGGKNPRSFPIALGIITLTFGTLSFLAIRNISIFGLILLPFLTYLVANGVCGEKTSRTATAGEPDASRARDDSVFFHANSSSDVLLATSIIVSLILLVTIPIRFSSHMPWNPTWGVGLLPEVNASAEFVREHEIEGPFFNNYDIGGYLIFHKFPEERVFVDNRPEAYSVEFFQQTYVPMQENTEIWGEELEKHNFNTIWFYRHDFTPWAQQFLIARIEDPEWAPVYIDNYVIIFLHRTPKNQSLIEKYELPKNLFSVS